MTPDRDDPLAPIASYYEGCLRAHGASPRGVDWRDADGQLRRFRELLQGVDVADLGSIADLGCGYGALAGFVHATIGPIPYVGYDISEAMLAAARAQCAHLPGVRFRRAAVPLERADVIVASGIFNVRLDADDDRWREQVYRTIRAMVAHADRAVAFNCLTAFSDAGRKEPRLWYPDPGQLLDWCLGEFGRHVALWHDSGHYEFTVRIRVARPEPSPRTPAGPS